MIGLVLNDTSRKVAGGKLDSGPGPVECGDPNLARSRDTAAHVGDAEAAFPILDQIWRKRQ